jgi:hypothetical protein
MKEKNSSKPSANFPPEFEIAQGRITIRNGIIPHLEIFRISKPAHELIDTYHKRILTQKTRTVRLLGKKSSATILHTLLGYEVQASYKRIQCPDLPTARYLKLFSELGCRSVKLPYDPTLTAELIPELERMFKSIKRQIREYFPQDPAIQIYVIQRLFNTIRQKLSGT